MENYYQSLLTSNQDAYNMIEPNTTWYLGTVGSQVNYKAGICKTVNDKISARDCERTDEMVKTNIGLPRAGEMFTSQITRGTKAGAWTLTPWNSSDMRNIWYDGNLVYVNLTNNSGARPSMYLKRNVVIASNNTGNGTYEYPYKIELNQ